MKKPQVVKRIKPSASVAHAKTRTIKIKISKAQLERAHKLALANGEIRMRKVAAHAEAACPGFVWKAQQVTVKLLKAFGKASSEELTDAIKACGLKPHDDRAFGAVYQGLARAERIRVVESCSRRKGHGTSGGRVWALV